MERRTLLFAGAAASVALAGCAAEPPPRGERHPEIEAAISEVEAARDDLQHAAHDFGGHRVAAMRACDEAVRQLQLALQFADRR